MVHLAACLAGFGGLLLEMLFVRRHGLLIGNTASASATVLALFLLGLGVGGLWLPRIAIAKWCPSVRRCFSMSPATVPGIRRI